jgi:AmmeMemoRadiSam system protein A
MSSLPNPKKCILLEVARQGLTLAVERGELLENLPPELEHDQELTQPAGAFITLRRRGRLRGCIGQLPSGFPLISVVAYCARAAALEDPRFDPVRPDELAEIEIEISVLSNPEDITPDHIEIGRHGLVVSKGGHRGLLLPQVAVQFGWDAKRFLEEACVKGGLDRNAWTEASTRVQVFTAEIFTESMLAQGAASEAAGPLPGYSSST